MSDNRVYQGLRPFIAIRAVVLIRVERAYCPWSHPPTNRAEEQVKDRWRRHWRKLWEGVEE
jgi:hypothetical protein